MSWTPQEFLEWLTPKLQQKDLFPAKPVKLTQVFDRVTIGTCSSGNGHGFFAHTVRDDVPNPDFFESVQEYKPKRVLLLCECCGAYSESFQEQLRTMYPETEYVVPSVRDYSENICPTEVRKDLLRLGFLCEEV